MAKETSHSRSAAALAEDLSKRLHISDHKLEKKATNERNLSEERKDMDPWWARRKARNFWAEATLGNLPDDVAALTPLVRTQILAYREEEMARLSVFLEQWVAREKKVSEYLSSHKAAILTPDKRAWYEHLRKGYGKNVRKRQDRIAQLLLFLTLLDPSKE